MAKESVVKKAGKFVANELLGIDDAKRAVSKAAKGDIKGAIKSAATAALEAGSTLSVAGGAAKLGGKMAVKAAEKKLVERAASAGKEAEKIALERTPAGKLGSEGGKTKSIKADTAKVTGKSGSTSVAPNAKSVEITTPKRSFKEQVGDAKRQDTKRETIGMNAKYDTAEAVVKSGQKDVAKAEVKGKVTGAVAGTAAVASTKKTESSTQLGNVRHRDYTKKAK